MVTQTNPESSSGNTLTSPRLIRLTEVTRRIGMGRSWVYEQIKKDEFPRPLTYGGRAVLWVEAEINDWIERQIASREVSQ